MTRLDQPWLTNGQFDALVQRESRLVECLSKKLSTQSVGLLGDGDFVNLLRICPASEKFLLNTSRLTPRVYEGVSSCVTEADMLPLLENSLDLLILPHVHESVQDKSVLFSEVHRILKPNGHVILFGFHPMSALGIKYWFCRHSRAHAMHFLSQAQSWCELQELTCLSYQRFFFSWLKENKSRGVKPRFEGWCRALIPWVADTYVLLLKKKVLGMTPLSVTWREKERKVLDVTKGVVTPMRKENHD